MRYYTTAQAAERVGRHKKSLRRALIEGELHGFQRGAGTHWLIDEDCLQAWAEGRRCKHGK